MGENFDALTGSARLAVEWKARENMQMALANGNPLAAGNREKFMENNCESLASNKESLRHVIREYNETLSSIPKDD